MIFDISTCHFPAPLLFFRFLCPIKADSPWPTFMSIQIVLDPDRLTYIAQTAFLDQSRCEIWFDP